MWQIMKFYQRVVDNQIGSVINIALLILILLTLMGISFVELSSTDIKIAGNDRTAKMAFYAAEAARNYVISTPSLYGTGNITVGLSKSFPLASDTTGLVDSLGTKQNFTGEVKYIGAGQPFPGDGFGYGTVRYHNYLVTGTGIGPRNARSQIEVGIARLGQ